MRWPWVSRLAFEMVREERDRLREHNDTLTTHNVSLQRKSFGMKETPTPERSKDPEWMTEQIPDNVMDVVGGFASEEMQNAMVIDIRAARRQGTRWEDIHRLLTEEDGQ